MFVKGCKEKRWFSEISTVENCSVLLQLFKEQDKSSDIEQQLPFGDRKYSNTLPKKKGGYKTNGNII